MREIPPAILHGWYKLEQGEEYVRGNILLYASESKGFTAFLGHFIMDIVPLAAIIYYIWADFPSTFSYVFILLIMLYVLRQASYIGYIHISNEDQSALTTNKRILLNNRFPSIAPSFVSVPFASINSIAYVREYEKEELMKILYLYNGRTEMAYVKVKSVREYIAEVAPLIRREKEIATAAK